MAIVSNDEAKVFAGIPDPTETQQTLITAALNAATGAVIRYLQRDPEYKERTEFYPQIDLTHGPNEFIYEVTATTAYVRFLEEAATELLQARHFPIRSITSLYIDYDGRFGTRSGSFGAETLQVSGQDYWASWDSKDSNGDDICKDGIIRSHGRWPSEPGSVKLTYYAGYKPAELNGTDTIINAYPIKDAVIDEFQRRYAKMTSRITSATTGLGPLTLEILGDYQRGMDSGILNTLMGGTYDLLPETKEKLNEFVPWHMGIL